MSGFSYHGNLHYILNASCLFFTVRGRGTKSLQIWSHYFIAFTALHVFAEQRWYVPAFSECFAQENCRWKQLCERGIVQWVGSLPVLATAEGRRVLVLVFTKRQWQTALVMMMIIIIIIISIIIIIIIMQFPFYLFSSLCSLINIVYWCRYFLF